MQINLQQRSLQSAIHHLTQLPWTASWCQSLVLALSSVYHFTLDCWWCIEQPCLAKCLSGGISNCFLIHLDDLPCAGSYDCWVNKFLTAMNSKFNVSSSELNGDGSSISFLMRQLVKLSDGLLIVPGTTADKVVAYFENFFGVARNQKIPCDGSIQNDDKSQLLNDGDSKAYRSVTSFVIFLDVCSGGAVSIHVCSHCLLFTKVSKAHWLPQGQWRHGH